jgi:hypothetical protein
MAKLHRSNAYDSSLFYPAIVSSERKKLTLKDNKQKNPFIN